MTVLDTETIDPDIGALIISSRLSLYNAVHLTNISTLVNTALQFIHICWLDNCARNNFHTVIVWIKRDSCAWKQSKEARQRRKKEAAITGTI